MPNKIELTLEQSQQGVSNDILTLSSANSGKQDLPQRYQVYQGRLLASFQDDAKYEHGGQDTSLQGGKDGKIVKEEEEAIKKIKGEALKEKDDLGAFIFPIRLEGKVGVTTIIAKFLILDIPIDHDASILTMGTYDDKAGSSRSKRSRQHETMEEVLLPQVHHEFLLWEGCNKDAKSKLGLYQAIELDEEGFNVYFEGGLLSDEHFNAQEYWLSISREDKIGLSRSTSTIKSLILRVIHKMITYSLYQRTTGFDKIQKNDLWLLSMFDARHQNGYANVAWLIARWMKRKGAST
nr:hypothetical protein [Tanacetum cinerariifolium]